MMKMSMYFLSFVSSENTALLEAVNIGALWILVVMVDLRFSVRELTHTQKLISIGLQPDHNPKGRNMCQAIQKRGQVWRI
jgi:hypothetical protein